MSLTVLLGLLLASGGFPLVRSTCPSQCSCFYHNLSDGSRARWVCVLLSQLYLIHAMHFSPLEMWCTCAFLIFAYSTFITLHRLHIVGYDIYLHRKYLFIYSYFSRLSLRVLKYGNFNSVYFFSQFNQENNIFRFHCAIWVHFDANNDLTIFFFLTSICSVSQRPLVLKIRSALAFKSLIIALYSCFLCVLQERDLQRSRDFPGARHFPRRHLET